jgi:hypothetical protein
MNKGLVLFYTLQVKMMLIWLVLISLLSKVEMNLKKPLNIPLFLGH